MSNLPKDDPVHYSEWISLIGFELEDQAVGIIQGSGIKDFKKEEWLPKIRKARDAVDRISKRREIQPEVREFEHKYDDRITRLRNEEVFREHLTGMVSHKFAFVELSKIHCFQNLLNKEFVDSLLNIAPDPDNVDETVKFCLPTLDERQKSEVISTFNPTTNTFSLITENLDFRVIGNVQGEDEKTKRKFAGFVYGFGLPQMSVVNYNGFHILKNGYHRALALLKKGHKFLPCILLSTDSYQNTGGQAPGFFPIDLVISDKSPIISDFNNDAAIIIPRRRFKMMITMHAETQVVHV